MYTVTQALHTSTFLATACLHIVIRVYPYTNLFLVVLLFFRNIWKVVAFGICGHRGVVNRKRRRRCDTNGRGTHVCTFIMSACVKRYDKLIGTSSALIAIAFCERIWAERRRNVRHRHDCWPVAPRPGSPATHPA
ncbi:hypothetical protein BDW22DRAFT_16714 [Trametopsis cervina]|nr:hypothetical protein BDW22DRAFT_16714 [Trametopsis cervina]